MSVPATEGLDSLTSGSMLTSEVWQYGRLHPMPQCVPPGWKLVQLTEVARLESGHTPSRKHPEYWDGDVPWISLADTRALGGNRILSTAQTIGLRGLENSSARLLPEGTVVFSRTATVGKCTIMGREMSTSQDFANYVCGPHLHNSYLMHLLRHLQVEWERLRAGSTHNTIYMPVFRALQILLPPPPEQWKIAAILSAVDETIEKTAAVIEQLRTVKKAMMDELLTRGLPGRHTRFIMTEIGEVPESWEPERIGHLVSFEGGSQPPRATFTSEPRPGYVRLLQIRDYKTDRYATYVPESNKLTRRFCNADDVMIGRYGPPIFQILRGLSGAYNVALIKATPDTSRLSKDYLYYYLQRRDLYELIEHLSQRTSGQTGVDMDALREFGLPLPPQDEQRAIVTLLSAIHDRISANLRLVHGLREMKNALSSVLLSGELRVRVDEEPA